MLGCVSRYAPNCLIWTAIYCTVSHLDSHMWHSASSGQSFVALCIIRTTIYGTVPHMNNCMWYGSSSVHIFVARCYIWTTMGCTVHHLEIHMWHCAYMLHCICHDKLCKLYASINSHTNILRFPHTHKITSVTNWTCFDYKYDLYMMEKDTFVYIMLFFYLL